MDRLDLYRSRKPMSRRALRCAQPPAASAISAWRTAGSKLAERGKRQSAGAESAALRAQAKRVIFLFMHGGPSSIDTFDPKARLTRDHGKPLRSSGRWRSPKSAPGPLMKSPWEFKQYGQSGIPVSDLFPHVRDVRRRSVRDPLDGRRRRGSRRGAAADLHRHEHVHAAEHGLVGRLRAGHREPESAGLHHDQAVALARRREELELGFLPGAYQGTAIGHAGMKVEDIKASRSST